MSSVGYFVRLFKTFKSLLVALVGERERELVNALFRVDKLIAYMPTSVIRKTLRES